MGSWSEGMLSTVTEKAQHSVALCHLHVHISAVEEVEQEMLALSWFFHFRMLSPISSWYAATHIQGGSLLLSELILCRNALTDTPKGVLHQFPRDLLA